MSRVFTEDFATRLEALNRVARELRAMGYHTASESIGEGRDFDPSSFLDEAREVMLALAKEATAHLDNVSVVGFDDLLVHFAEEIDCKFVVKGLRAITDFEYEFQMTAANYRLNDSIETVFIMSPPQYMYLSSSIVREIASFHGNISELVTPGVEKALRARFSC